MLLLASGCAQSADEIRGRARVIDGDSIIVDRVEIRLWGVDAPEYKQRCRRNHRNWECGKAATKALRSRLSGRSLRCRRISKDRHDRVVARCKANNESINRWLVRNGWALDYRRFSKGAFAGEQSRAKAQRKGIWSAEFEAPEKYRRRNRR